MEDLDVAGEWWLPARPERRVGGRLTYSVESGARLSLIGSLRDWDEEGRRVGEGVVEFGEDDLDRAGDYGRIHGQVESKAFTLDGCFRTRMNRNLFGGVPTEDVLANRVFRGVWYGPEEQVVGHRLSTRLLHLVYWVHESGLKEQWRWGNETHSANATDDDPTLTVWAERVPSKEVTLGNGALLKIVQALGVDGDRFAERAIRQDFELSIELPDAGPLEELMALMHDAHDVVSIGLDRAACIESISLFHPDLAYGEGGRRHLLPVDILAQWSDREGWRQPKVLVSRDVLFTLPDLGGALGFERVLRTAAEYRSELRRVAATADGKSMFPSDRLINRAAALESFDRRRTGFENSHFRTRINRCTKLAGHPFEALVPDLESWVALFKSLRNTRAHHLDRTLSEDGFADLIMADCAYFLFVLCLLRESDAPDGVFDLIEQNSRFSWLAKQVPAVLDAES